jgi:peroxin-1
MKPKAPESQVIQPASSFVDGKGKEKATGTGSSGPSKGFKARLVPGRVASAWGSPDSPGKDGKVVYCSRETLSRARRKFGADGDVLVSLERMRRKEDEDTTEKTQEAAATEGAEGVEKREDKLECWLVAWEEVPDGHVVLAGKADEGWEGWQVVR